MLRLQKVSFPAVAVNQPSTLSCVSISMTWRSPFQTSKGGGVPFPPSLTPWASSPAQPADAGSPMQISPFPNVTSVFKQSRHASGLKNFSTSRPSPMDAAPYTPLSALKAASTPAGKSNKDSSFVGKLSFTPHVSRQPQHVPQSAKGSPDA